MHTCDIGTDENLAQILAKYVDIYIETLRKADKPNEENKDIEMDLGECAKEDKPIIDKESGVVDVSGNFIKTKNIILNVLKTVQFLINANQS